MDRMLVMLFSHKSPDGLQQVKERKNKNPDHVDEVPIQAGILHAVSGIFAHCRPDCNDRENRDAAENVKSMESSDHEKACRELGHAPWIVRQPRSFFNQVSPFEGL